MKKRGIVFIFVLVLAVVIPVSGKDGDGFRAVTFTLAVSTWWDYGITAHALAQSPSLREGNPLTSWFLENRAAAYAINFSVTVILTKALDGLYQNNKTLAWITAGLFFVVKAYVFYHNLRLVGHV
jgi:hypothetical protein